MSTQKDIMRMDGLVNDLRERDNFQLLHKYHEKNNVKEDILFLKKLGFSVDVIDFSKRHVNLFSRLRRTEKFFCDSCQE